MSGVGHPTARAATTLSGLALLSPVAGMAVEIALAWRFGASPTVDAFRIGALLLLFGQQLFVLQILPHAVVPVFSEYRARGEEQEAWHVALSLANLLVVPALLVSLLVILYPKPVVGLLAPGLAGEAKELAALFIRWFLPTCVLLVWNGVAVGVLYAHDVFAVPPAAQLLGNLVLVAAILTLGRALGPTSLVIAVLASAVLGSLLYASRLFPLMRQAGARPSWKLDIRHPGVRKSLKLAAPLLGTILLSQWISVVGNRALSGLPPGNIALFGYAWKLGQLVLLVPLSLATVLFPRLADARFSRPVGEFPELCIRALRMALFIAIPLACLLFIFRVRLVTLLFERGAFSAEASRAVAGLFALLLLGSPAAAVAVNLEKMFYAGQQTRVPMYVQLSSAIVATFLAPTAARLRGAAGLMLLFGAVLAWINAGLLFFLLQRRHPGVAVKRVAGFAGETLLLALLAAWAAGHAGQLLQQAAPRGVFSAGLATAGGLATGGLVFLAAALALRVPEALAWRDYARWQGEALVRSVQRAVAR